MIRVGRSPSVATEACATEACATVAASKPQIAVEITTRALVSSICSDIGFDREHRTFTGANPTNFSSIETCYVMVTCEYANTLELPVMHHQFGWC